MYRYLQDIKRNIIFDSTVMSFFPFIFFKLGRTDLTQDEIQKGISFELARKKRKYFYIKYLWSFYEAFLSVLFVIYYRRFTYALSKKIPDLICIWNGHRLPEYAIKLIAKKNNIKLRGEILSKAYTMLYIHQRKIVADQEDLAVASKLASP